LSVFPHPNPLPEGEGDNPTPAIMRREREMASPRPSCTQAKMIRPVVLQGEGVSSAFFVIGPTVEKEQNSGFLKKQVTTE